MTATGRIEFRFPSPHPVVATPVNSSIREQPEYQSALNFLLNRVNFERTSTQGYNDQHYRLSRMSALLDALDNPQAAAKVIHVAGTKGKGSVSWLVAESLRHSGYRVGLYTSPHLETLEERFMVQGHAIDPATLIEQCEILARAEKRIAEQGHTGATFFELTTALAWLVFRKNQTDWNVVEVGMGGRLDCTNVCQPEVCVITNISFDHQQFLGDTIQSIASEKAGIIKPGASVVNAAGSEEARAVVRQVAEKHNAPICEQSLDFSHEWSLNPTTTLPRSGLFQFVSKSAKDRLLETSEPVRLKMLGEHQASNAAIACAVLEVLNRRGTPVKPRAIRTALETTQVPARLEFFAGAPNVLLDAAHNPASIHALGQTVEQHFGTSQCIAVFACSKDKDAREMLRLLDSFCSHVIITNYSNAFRSNPVEELQTIVESQSRRANFHYATNSLLAFQQAKQLAESKGLVCIAGSFFLAADLRPTLTGI